MPLSLSKGPEDRAEDFPLIRDDLYERGSEVARGGLGRIIQGFDRRLARRVALKELISRDPKAERRFIREAKITARLEHPNIVPIHEAGRWPDGERFYAMKLVEGRTLTEALAGASTREERLRLLPHLIDVADAVAYAHSEGILHRDLKPANVMVGAFGETLVIDWGLAKALDGDDAEEDSLSGEVGASSWRGESETSDGIVVGTPPYMAPEQARADPLDERADVYALGAMLYQVLCGHRPYEEVKPKDVLLAVVNGPPLPIDRLATDMPKDLVAIVNKAMHRNPALRYPSAKEMAEELRRFTTGQLVVAHRYSPFERGLRFVRRNLAAVAVALTLVTVLTVFAIWSFRGLAIRTEAADRAREEAEQRVRQFTLEKARSLLARDPTEAVAWLKKVKPPLPGLASVAAEAQDRGVARSILSGHLQEVERVRIDPRGRFVVSASRDGTARLWSLSGGSVRVLPHGSRVSALDVSGDGSLIATGAYDGSVRVLSLGDAAAPRVLEGHHAPVVAVRFAPTGDRLVSLGRDRRLVLWTLDGRAVEVLETPPVGDWADVRFLDEGRRLVSGGHGSRVLLWDLAKAEGRELAAVGAEVSAIADLDARVAIGASDGSVALVDPDSGATRTLGGHPDEVRALAFAPGGKYLASGGFDGQVYRWNLSAPEPPEVFDAHDERITAIQFSPSGRWLASASWDGTVRVRDLSTGEDHTFQGHGQVVTDLSFGPRERQLASSSWDTTVRIWPLRRTGARVLRGHTIGVHAVDFSPDGRTLASGGHDDDLRLWNLRTSRPKVLAGHGDNVFRVRFSPDGRHLASSSDDRTVRVWSAEGRAEHVLSGHQGDVEELAYSPDGLALASAGRAGDLFVWTVATGVGRALTGHEGAVSGLGFVSGGGLASAGLDGRVYLWPPVSAGGGPRVLLEAEDALRGLHVSRDGSRLAVAGGAGEVRVWSMPEGKLLQRLTGLTEPDMVRLSPDGSLAAVASAQRGLWLCSLAYELCDPLEGHEARVFDLAFSPSGRALASGSGDHSVRLWDVSTLESRVLRGHRAPVFDVAISADGAWVASGSGDTDVRLWPLSLPPRPAQLAAYLDELTAHTVSSEDRD